MKKKILSTLLAICLLVGCLPLAASAKEEPSGKCGKNVTWSLDENTEILTISGTGEMADYCVYPDVDGYSLTKNIRPLAKDNSETIYPPWYDKREKVKIVEIQEGVTYVGRQSFVDLTLLTHISFPDSIVRFGDALLLGSDKLASIAFLDQEVLSNFDSATLPDGSYISNLFLSFSIPSSVKKIFGIKGGYAEWYARFRNIPFVENSHLSPNYPSTIFTDIKSSDYFYESVNWAVENGITSGTSETRFSPNDSCTRAQAVTFLWRAAGNPEPASSETGFHDVKPGAYYEKAVQWAVENGITSGTSSERFSPNATCTRAQIVTFLYRAENSPDVSGSDSFSDVGADEYYTNAVKWAVQNDITTGTENGKFSPESSCARGQIVTFLYRYAS